MFKKFLFVLAWLFSGHAFATENMYVVVGGSYSSAEYEDSDVDGAGVKFAVGYQFHPQWYLELGYQQIAGESLQLSVPSEQTSVDLFEPGLQSDALFAALLGKAANRVGELFYRIGVKRVDNNGQLLIQGDSCRLGSSIQSSEIQGIQYQLCEYDEGVLAGVIGLGFDYFVGNKSMIRTEIEYVGGEQDFQASTIFIGYRYNF